MNVEATAVRNTKPMGVAVPGRWSAPPSDAAVRAVVRLGLIPLRLLQTQVGRRLAAPAVLSLCLARPAKDPQSAAVAWYARRLRISPDRVQALQQQRVNGSTTKVLVMAQVSETNVPTAFVTVKRAGSGWKVP